MRTVYVAHPLGGGPDREQNRANAAKWCAWIVRTHGVAVIADWIILSGEWDESPENRGLGLAVDAELVSRADEVWLVGGRISPGMEFEAGVGRKLGKPIVDLTGMGALPPASEVA